MIILSTEFPKLTWYQTLNPSLQAKAIDPASAPFLSLFFCFSISFPSLFFFKTMAALASANDKPYGISQIKAYNPITLDMSKLNYDKWRELFETHCVSFGVVQHLDGSSLPTPETEKEWK